MEFTDPVCGRPRAAYEWKADRDGRERWFIGCAHCSNTLSGSEWLGLLAEHAGCRPFHLLQQPSEWLDPWERGDAPAEPPPLSPRLVRRRLVKPRTHPAAWEWLRGYWGLSPEVIAEARIGWGPRWARVRQGWYGPEGLILPYFLGGKLVAFKTRVLGDRLIKPAGSGAWDWPLYPEPRSNTGRTWLVEGEGDALRLRSLGIPATSVTGGKDQWRPEWAEQLRGLRVYVMFDAGAEASALKRVEALRAAGVWARRVCAADFGLSEHNADVSDYLRNGGDAARLRRWVKAG